METLLCFRNGLIYKFANLVRKAFVGKRARSLEVSCFVAMVPEFGVVGVPSSLVYRER